MRGPDAGGPGGGSSEGLRRSDGGRGARCGWSKRDLDGDLSGREGCWEGLWW